jgi:hypothetical protein
MVYTIYVTADGTMLMVFLPISLIPVNLPVEQMLMWWCLSECIRAVCSLCFQSFSVMLLPKKGLH